MNKRGFAAFPAALLIGLSMPAVPAQAAVVLIVAAPTKTAPTSTVRHQDWSTRAAAGRPTRAATPQLAPRSLSGQFVQDPSFSGGPNGTAWTKSSNGGRTLIDGTNPHTAPYSVDLCQNAANCQDGVAQLITRPGYIFSATLTYWFVLRSPGDPTACNDVLQIGMELPGGGGGAGAGAQYCPDWNGAPYVWDRIDETLFLRNMQSDTAMVVAQAFSDSAGASRYWVDDITLDIVWGTPPGQPTGVLAEPHNGSVTLRWQAPSAGSEPVTAHSALVFPGGYEYHIDSGTTTAVIPMLINGQAYSFEVAAISPAGQGPYSAMSNTVTPAAALPYEAVSTQQYSLSDSDGVTWKALGTGYNQGLPLNVTPTVDSMALITANADLWTSSAGVNQDLGIAVRSTPGSSYPTLPGQPEAWKESGGYNGTFSPNAAAVQVGLPLTAGNTYVITLVWKSNKPSPGATIYAGAGPIGSGFSPTRLTVQLEPLAANRIVDAAGYGQFHPTVPADSVNFTDLGPGSPAIHYLASRNGVVILTGNADLWTTTAGFNQDLAITVNGTVAAWKESGSFGGTYSPNAALVEAVIPVAASMTYDVKLQWKPNHDSYHPPIYAGAGPIGTKYSPTRLTLYFIPNATLATSDASSTKQYAMTKNDGRAWGDVDATNLSLSITPPGDCLAILTGNADLWTTTAGFNQDLGIAVSSALGTYAPDRVGWKESGAVIGAYSPNAAYVQMSFPMVGATTYTVKLQWKSNKAQAGPTIYAAAGAAAPYSPTRLTAELVCPPEPVVTSVSPSSGPSSGGTSVTITGSNLDQGVVFFGAAQAAVTSWSATQIVVTSPAHPVGTVDVTVRTGNGTTATSAADRFTYSYATTILADSPSIYYRFGETSGLVAADSSGNAHDATYSATGVTLGVAGAIAGDVDTAISFDATNGIVQEKSGAGLPVGNASRSVECWFNTTYTGGMIAAWGTRSSTANQFFGVSIGVGTISWVVVDLGPGKWSIPTLGSSRNLADAMWHHMVLTYDGPSGTLTAYIDGQLFGSVAVQGSINTTLNVQGVTIGNDPTDPNLTGDLYKGAMDELAIYPIALTAAQVAKHYSAGRGR